jgi:hypothetical protein
MEGRSASPKDQGMIPRAVTQIFATSSDLRDKGWQVRAILMVLFLLVQEF